MDLHRQTGRTSRQMKNAPFQSIYVWPNSNTHYARLLTRYIHRWDITVVSPSFIISEGWRGMVNPRIVIDHAVFTLVSETKFWDAYYRFLYWRFKGVK